MSFEYHPVCNMKCTYCSEVYYGGVRPKFDIIGFADSVERVSPDLHIAWGGGEPTALRDFDQVFSFAQERFQPKTQRIFTNALKYSPVIQAAVDERRVSLTTSIDAGTADTFEKIRRSSGMEKVFKHLQAYSRQSPDLVTIKYIFVSENHASMELDGFVDKIIAHDLQACSFLISTDFKIENEIFSYLDSIMYLFFRLQEIGVGAVSLDDHVFARLKERGFAGLQAEETPDPDRKMIKDRIQKSLDRFAGSDVILWGTGEFARRLLDNPSFRRNFNVIKVVDPSQTRHGMDFQGHTVRPVSDIGLDETNIVIGSVNFYGEVFNELKRMQIDRTRVVPPFLVY
ncbi:radical SAM protein [Roseibium aquae]|uniref:radical SAM protein n=1 Tax=Roseibium aquae TaxID=1323746 RepID=UPI00313BE647